MALKDDINIPLLVSLGLATAAIVVLTVIGTEAVFYKVENSTLERRYAEQGPTLARQVWQPQIDSLSAPPSWTGPERTHARVPIDFAIAELAKNNGKLPAN